MQPVVTGNGDSGENGYYHRDDLNIERDVHCGHSALLQRFWLSIIEVCAFIPRYIASNAHAFVSSLRCTLVLLPLQKLERIHFTSFGVALQPPPRGRLLRTGPAEAFTRDQFPRPDVDSFFTRCRPRSRPAVDRDPGPRGRVLRGCLVQLLLALPRQTS